MRKVLFEAKRNPSLKKKNTHVYIFEKGLLLEFCTEIHCLGKKKMSVASKILPKVDHNASNGNGGD